ncbi:MAG: PilZ domain-containing protein [Candidatus Omnitrophica bacterium]|nr:PilZ domain-containing protein [Candidatus Omnitrophota bacterium]
MENFKEKRQTPRIEKKLPLKVMEGDYCTVVETKNISATGVYFTTDKPLPLMSKVMITLLLPGTRSKNKKIVCSGTVVRIVPIDSEKKQIFETAIFFDDVTDKTREAISRYVKKMMPV